jgi:hypothetical protein
MMKQNNIKWLNAKKGFILDVNVYGGLM